MSAKPKAKPYAGVMQGHMEAMLKAGAEIAAEGGPVLMSEVVARSGVPTSSARTALIRMGDAWPHPRVSKAEAARARALRRWSRAAPGRGRTTPRPRPEPLPFTRDDGTRSIGCRIPPGVELTADTDDGRRLEVFGHIFAGCDPHDRRDEIPAYVPRGPFHAVDRTEPADPKAITRMMRADHRRTWGKGRKVV